MRQFKKYSGLLAIALISFALVFATQSCKKDDDDDDNGGGSAPDPSEKFIGKYVFASATFNAAPSDSIVMPPDSVGVAFNAGDDAANFVGGGLFKESPCQDPQQTALELRANKDLYYVCMDNSGEAKFGVWDFDSSTGVLSLTINMSGSPVPFEVLIANADVSSNVLTGNITNLPLPLNAYYDIGAILPGGVVNMQMGNVSTTFNVIP